MQALLHFIRSGKCWLHVTLALGVLALLLVLTLSWLKSFTDHNEQVEVPDFTGLEVPKLDSFLQAKEVQVQIVDSIYDAKQKGGIVLHQEPEPGTAVKHNRTVYLYVTSLVAPQMRMPKLIDRSERQARLIIETYGLKVGPITEQAADCNGCVIDQRQGGKSIAPGTPVKKGSSINLVIGRKSSYFNTTGQDSLVPETKNTQPQP